MYVDEGWLNAGQRRAIETALIPGYKLLLVQGPPGKLRGCFMYVYRILNLYIGTGKSMLCVEMIRRFVDHNYEGTSSRGPTVLYCAPSNKAVNVGACMYDY